MKHKLLNKLLTLTLFILGGALFSPAWATDVTYTFTAKEWTSASGNWSGDAGSAKDTKGVQCLKDVTYTVTSPSSLSNISSIVVTYGTASKTTTSSTISIKIGSGSAVSKNVAGKSLTDKTLTWNYSPIQSGSIEMKVTAAGASVYIKSVKVTYTPTHTLTYSATNGSIGGVVYNTSTAVASGASVAEGGKVTLTATPASGYSFTGWNVSGTGSSLSSTSTNPTTFTMGTANATVTANFEAVSTTQVATPTFSVTEGTYSETKSVELSCATDDATIYYTTNGDDPTTSSTEYTGTAIAVNATTTIKAFAVKDGLDDSEIASATYTLKCATPTISIPSGVFVSTKNVTIECSTTDAAISYSTDDGENWTAYSAPFSISATTSVKAKTTKSGWSDSDEASETFTKETVLEGLSALVVKTNTSEQSYYVELSDAQVTYVYGKNGFMEDADAGIYIYNISPTLNKVYNGIFRVTYQLYNSMPELKAITAIEGEGEITDGNTKSPTEMTASELSTAFNETLGRQIQITGHTTTTTTVLVTGISFYTTYYNPSFVKDHIYTIVGYPYNNNGTLQFRVISAVEKPDAPTISPDGGEFSKDFKLTLSAVTGATIRYTTDGSTPTASLGSVYDPENKPTISTGADITVKAVAILAGMTSDVASTTYTYSALSKPSFVPVDGTAVYYGETIALSSDVDGSTIYYTTDGSTPTNSSSVYSEPIAIKANSVTIKAKTNKGDDWSSEASATFTLKTPDAPTAEPGAGAVESGTNVELNSRAGTTIYYTIDGTTPSNESTPYSSAITIDAAKTINAIAYDGAGNNSTVLTATYSIIKVDTPTFGTATSLFPISQEVSINCETDGATIYYTTDGSIPTTSSSEYSAPFNVTTTTTVKAIAVKANCTNSDVASVTYTKAKVYTVSEVKDGDVAGKSNVYVIGYIVGSYNATSPVKSGSLVDTNLALADDAGETSGSKTIPVELSSGSGLRTSWGPASNSQNIDVAKVIIKGNGQDYFSVRAIKGTSEITKVAEAVKVTASSYATYASDDDLDFTDSNIKAYIAKAKDDGTGVTFERVYKIPAETGVLLYKDGGTTEAIPVFDPDKENADNTDGNVFVRGEGVAVASEDDNKRNYILSKVNNVVGFYRANNKVVAKNRAYIQVESASLAKDFISMPGFDDSTTGVNEVNGSGLMINGPVYDLQGRRVEKPGKGLYIVNGKKVLKY